MPVCKEIQLFVTVGVVFFLENRWQERQENRSKFIFKFLLFNAASGKYVLFLNIKK